MMKDCCALKNCVIGKTRIFRFILFLAATLILSTINVTGYQRKSVRVYNENETIAYIPNEQNRTKALVYSNLTKARLYGNPTQYSTFVNPNSANFPDYTSAFGVDSNVNNHYTLQDPLNSNLIQNEDNIQSFNSYSQDTLQPQSYGAPPPQPYAPSLPPPQPYPMYGNGHRGPCHFSQQCPQPCNFGCPLPQLPPLTLPTLPPLPQPPCICPPPKICMPKICPPPPLCPISLPPPPCPLPAPCPLPLPPKCPLPAPIFPPPAPLFPPPAPLLPQPNRCPMPFYGSQNDCCCNCQRPCQTIRLRRYSLNAAYGIKTKAFEQKTDRNANAKCNSVKLQRIIQENISSDLEESKRNIQSTAESQLDRAFNTICGKAEFSFIVHAKLYCQATVNTTTCYTFSHF